MFLQCVRLYEYIYYVYRVSQIYLLKYLLYLCICANIYSSLDLTIIIFFFFKTTFENIIFSRIHLQRVNRSAGQYLILIFYMIYALDVRLHPFCNIIRYKYEYYDKKKLNYQSNGIPFFEIFFIFHCKILCSSYYFNLYRYRIHIILYNMRWFIVDKYKI